MMPVDRAREIEEQLTRFEKENPQLVETIKLMDLTIEEYNRILFNISTKDVITSSSTEV